MLALCAKVMKKAEKQGGFPDFSAFLLFPIDFGRDVAELQVLFSRLDVAFVEEELGDGKYRYPLFQIFHDFRLLFLAEGHDAESAVGIDIHMRLDGADKSVLRQALVARPVYP